MNGPTIDPKQGDADLQTLIGMDEADAIRELGAAGWQFRVVELDGEPLFGTCDWWTNRANLKVAGGKVIGASVG